MAASSLTRFEIERAIGRLDDLVDAHDDGLVEVDNIDELRGVVNGLTYALGYDRFGIRRWLKQAETVATAKAAG